MKKLIFSAIALTSLLAVSCGSGDDKKDKPTDDKANFEVCRVMMKDLLGVYKAIDTTAPMVDTVYAPLPENYRDKYFTLYCSEYKFLEFLSDTTQRNALKEYKPFRTVGVNTCLTDKDLLGYAFWGQEKDVDYAKFLAGDIERVSKENYTLVAILTPLELNDPIVGSGEFTGGYAKCYVQIFDLKTHKLYCSYFAEGENAESIKVPESANGVTAQKYLVTDLRFNLMNSVSAGLKERAGMKATAIILQ